MTPPRKIKAAAIQMRVTDETVRNRDRAIELLGMAADRGAQAAVLGALSLWPWILASPEREAARASAWKVEALDSIREVAREKTLVVLLPFLEKAGPEEHLFNSTAVIDADGDLRGVYRKTHLPDIPFWREREIFEAGRELPVFDTQAGRIGVLICWDLLYPEAARRLADQGADWIAAPTSHAFANHRRWEAAMAAAAFTNGIPLLRANRLGNSGGLDFYGESQSFGADGGRLGERMAMTDGIGLWDLDFDARDRVRAEWGLAAARRRDLY